MRAGGGASGGIEQDAAPLRVALIGYGLAGAAFHGPIIRATSGLEVAVIVTGHAERSESARSRHPGAEVVPDVERVWAMADRLDVAVVATPNRTHVPLALSALEAGLHVVVDKPVAPTSAEARRLVEEASRRELLLTPYHNRRWDGDFLTLRRLLDGDRLGDVRRFESRFERWRPEPKPGWRQDPDPAEGGGILYDIGPHLIDQALLLFGPIRDVYAELDRSRAGAAVDDDVFLALTHESGVRSHLWMNAISAKPGPRFRVLGSRGTWMKEGLDPQEARLRAGRDVREPGFGVDSEDDWGTLHDAEEARRTPTERGSYVTFYTRLGEAIRNGGPAPVPPADALAGLEVIEEAHRSARSRAGE